MIIDNKWPQFKGYLSEFKLSSRMSKSTLQQATVTSTEQKSVGLQLDADEQKKNSHKNENQFLKKVLNSSDEPKEQKKLEQKSEEGKKLNLKLLNLI